MDPDLVYVNVNLTNTDVPYIEAYAYNQYESAVITNPNEFEMSIVRFSIDSSLIPLFFPVIPNPGSPTTTNMSVTLRYAGVNYYRTFVQVSAQEAKNGVYDYQNFLNGVNVALASSFTALKAAFPAAAPTQAPVVFLNPTTGLVSMYCEYNYAVGTPNTIDVGLNEPLEELLNFRVLQSFGPGQALGFDEWLNIDGASLATPAGPLRVGYPSTLSLVPYSALTLIQFQQEYNSLADWNGITSIMFTTTTIPVVKEIVPINVSSGQNGSISRAYLPIVTDFDILKDQLSVNSRRIIEYLPTAEYRMKSLGGINPILAIDIRAFYKDYLGVQRPIYLTGGASMNLKIMFRRKKSNLFK